MKIKTQRLFAIAVILLFMAFASVVIILQMKFERVAVAQEKTAKTTPTPTPEFDQKAALAKLREQIKGKENEPAGKVFKNLQNLAEVPAGRLLAMMEFGYSRSLGVNCTHCHTPEKWESEEKSQKQIARDMHLMTAKINTELLGNIKSLGERKAIINCTTCHRGEVKPALNLPTS